MNLNDAWRTVEKARNPKRPTTLDYVSLIFDSFMELHGDRRFADDPALVGGIAFQGERAVTFLGTQKGRTIKESLERNYGMANPEGYRKAIRLAKQAELFGRPVITFIDTAGAFPGIGAEERGIGEAIARCLWEFSVLEVPVISFILGEGGSGGALALAVANEVYALENSVYSVITPEGCASILLRDSTRAPEAAAMLKITAKDLLGFGIVDGIIPEPPGGSQENPKAMAEAIKRRISESLSNLSEMSGDQLVRQRIERFQAYGQSEEQGKRPGFWQRLSSFYKPSDEG